MVEQTETVAGYTSQKKNLKQKNNCVLPGEKKSIQKTFKLGLSGLPIFDEMHFKKLEKKPIDVAKDIIQDIKDSSQNQVNAKDVFEKMFAKRQALFLTFQSKKEKFTSI